MAEQRFLVFAEIITLTAGDYNAISRELNTETLTLSDTVGPGFAYNETLTLGDTYARVWLSTPELTETLALADSFIPSVIKVLSETITLSDADEAFQYQVTPDGGYLVVSSLEATWHKALREVARLLEEQGAPKSQTSYLATFDATNKLFAVGAIVKRH